MGTYLRFVLIRGGLISKLSIFFNDDIKKRHNFLNQPDNKMHCTVILQAEFISQQPFLHHHHENLVSFSFFVSVEGSNTVYLLFCGAFLKSDIILQVYFP